MMYDTLNWRRPSGGISREHRERLKQTLSHVTESRNSHGYSFKGNLGNYKIKVSENWIKGEGSLAKFHLGNNVKTLTRKGTEEAIEHLSDLLSLDISKASPLRIDIAQNFRVSQDENSYFNLLGELPKFKRNQLSDGLYYTTQKKVLLFYSKVKELRHKGEMIPEPWNSGYMLRYELRYMERIGEQLNQGRPMTLAQVYSEKFYLQMLCEWEQYFQQIKKMTLLDTIKRTNSPKTLERQLATMSVKAIGEQVILEQIGYWREGVSTKERSRLRAMVRELADNPECTIESPLMEELESKIHEASRYAR